MKTPENMEQEIEISIAKPEDNRGIQEVFYKTWLDTYPNEEVGITVEDIEYKYKDRFTEEGLQKSLERMMNAPKDHFVFVAKDTDVVVGVCRAEATENGNRLLALYVLPEYQGKGIGKKLWAEAQKRFNSAKDTLVNVATYNANAIEFYKKLGFEDTGRRFIEENFKMKSGNTIPEQEMIIKAEKE
jgi:ribosomal protein S18 acetylase RimI-like enzyme